MTEPQTPQTSAAGNGSAPMLLPTLGSSSQYTPERLAERLLAATSVHSRSKRVFDVLFSALALALLAPVLVLLGLLVKATSRGPVLFRQRRVGLLGQPFVMFKIRSMYHEASEESHRAYMRSLVTGTDGVSTTDGLYKLRNDERVTPLGHFLRRTSLDELPQFWNVLRGEMSIVGPRPSLQYEVDLYEPWQWERLRVRPGLTGLWQVSGRNRHAYVDMVRLDLAYVRTWSFLGDLWIVLKTPWVMVPNSGDTA